MTRFKRPGPKTIKGRLMAALERRGYERDPNTAARGRIVMRHPDGRHPWAFIIGSGTFRYFPNRETANVIAASVTAPPRIESQLLLEGGRDA